MTAPQMSPAELESAATLVHLALAEDLGPTGDRTSLATVPESTRATAAFVARGPGVVAGLPVAALVCRDVSPGLQFTPLVPDGTVTTRGTRVATVSGPLRAVLAAERTALNFLQRLSGVASLTRKYLDAAAGHRAQVLDTRKTTPGWRLLEKYAVRTGGGTNHRVGLYDGILIKDNHLAGLGGDVRAAVVAAREYPGNAGLPVEVEVDTLEQLEHALAVKADIVLLDNMTLDQLRAAVARRDVSSPTTLLEASGGVNLETVRDIAGTGVDRISVGALTHSAPALDIGLDYLS
ncbi:carboxylating nicotinate-nucleotide diphosphorylase [Gemmata obscuriglobus]|uniref:Probable nicotinate-nucleotide pyrophosphorylase [carboxylating] n=1 Tax=Gemmata obscuriglobus TaxID=114 RepID=A0A2Z3GWW3_9BACT|nr:carboxylating nicotinate-nucleotide diphosphorylase [Gemmata obscuriglobus]AWM38233.1 nicotinate-nucleotide diphosphorylase (carboxylating) [Gemmata obscuriglobus]